MLTVLVSLSKVACGAGAGGSDHASSSGMIDGGDANVTGEGGADAEQTCASRSPGSWATMSSERAPSDVSNFETTSVMSAWTGRLLLVLYHGEAATYLNGSITGDLHGKSFDPESNTWNDLDIGSVPADAGWMRVLSSSSVLVWGKTSGAVFDPATTTWSTRALPDAPGANAGVFVGSKLVQIGHVPTDSYDHFESTRIYDFDKGSWATVSGVGAPTPRYGAAQIVAGDQLVVWGGYSARVSPTNPSAYVHPMESDGAILDVSTGTWTKVSDAGAPPARHTPEVALYAAGKVVLWGGQSIDLQTDKTTLLADGAVFDPLANAWSPMADTGAPTARWNTLHVAAGSKIVVYGGQSVWPAGANPFFTDGSTYDARANAWTPMPPSPTPLVVETPAPPGATWMWHQAEAAGSRVLFMNRKLDVVEAFDPSGDTWESVAVPPNMVGRSSYLAAWTGCRLVVFGGQIVGDVANACPPPHTIGCDPPAPPVTPFHDGAALTL